MISTQHYDSGFVKCEVNHVFKSFPTWWYIPPNHRVYNILNMLYVSVYGLNAYDFFCDPVLHGVYIIKQSISIQETVVCHNTFLYIHHLYPLCYEHVNSYPSTYFHQSFPMIALINNDIPPWCIWNMFWNYLGILTYFLVWSCEPPSGFHNPLIHKNYLWPFTYVYTFSNGV